MPILAGRYEDEVRPVLPQARHDDSVHRGHDLLIVKSAGQRYVDGLAEARASSGLADPARVRVERVFMEGYVEAFGVGRQDLGGAVAVVHIPVNDRDPAALTRRELGGDGYVVDQAETAAGRRVGMMAWRTGDDQRRGSGAARRVCSVPDRGRAGCGGQIAGRCHIGVDRQLAAASRGISAEEIQVALAVRGLQQLIRQWFRDGQVGDGRRMRPDGIRRVRSMTCCGNLDARQRPEQAGWRFGLRLRGVLGKDVGGDYL